MFLASVGFGLTERAVGVHPGPFYAEVAVQVEDRTG